jgi:hypothetical protein
MIGIWLKSEINQGKEIVYGEREIYDASSLLDWVAEAEDVNEYGLQTQPYVDERIVERIVHYF